LLSVKVKWGRELYTDIDVNTDEEPILFKAQLFALTGVQPDRLGQLLVSCSIQNQFLEFLSNESVKSLKARVVALFNEKAVKTS